MIKDAGLVNSGVNFRRFRPVGRLCNVRSKRHGGRGSHDGAFFGRDASTTEVIDGRRPLRIQPLRMVREP